MNVGNQAYILRITSIMDDLIIKGLASSFIYKRIYGKVGPLWW